MKQNIQYKGASIQNLKANNIQKEAWKDLSGTNKDRCQNDDMSQDNNQVKKQVDDKESDQ